MVSNAFDKSMDTTATISLLLRQRLQSSVSLINDVSQLQLYVDACMPKWNRTICCYRICSSERTRASWRCYLVLAAQSLVCNTRSWTCHVFWTTEWLGPFSTVMDNGLLQSSDSLCHIMDQKLSLLILREVREVLSHVHKICTCLYPCSSLVHGDVLQGGTSATQWQIIAKIKMIM